MRRAGCNPAFEGLIPSRPSTSSPSVTIRSAPVVQSAGRWSSKPGDAGSSPAGGAQLSFFALVVQRNRTSVYETDDGGSSPSERAADRVEVGFPSSGGSQARASEARWSVFDSLRRGRREVVSTSAGSYPASRRCDSGPCFAQRLVARAASLIRTTEKVRLLPLRPGHDSAVVVEWHTHCVEGAGSYREREGSTPSDSTEKALRGGSR